MSYPPPAQISAGEWNAPLFVSSGADLSGRAVTVTLIRPDGSWVTGSGTVQNREFHLPQSTMMPGKWIIYMIQEGDLPVAGLYTVQLDAVPPPPEEQIIQSTFRVGE